MTVEEILQSEEQNTHFVILHYEGMFWKAYERSAYLIYTQVNPFKVTKRFISKLAGAPIVSVGFPETVLEKYMSKYRIVERNATTLKYTGFNLFFEQDFLSWKNKVNFMPVQNPSRVSGSRKGASPRKAEIPFYQLPVYRLTQDLYQRIVSDRVLESIPKATKKRMLEPVIMFLWEILVDIYEVRELEKQLDMGENLLVDEIHREAYRLLMGTKRKTARCIVAFRLVFETKVDTPYKLLLIPQGLYEEYSESLVSIHYQLGCWARKHGQRNDD